ncbi:hypothetical protein Mapa_013466 [Marchantia paleacea]|nr:hypothetical protein Mapa_013466 [Marchantia paleacea]
MFSLACATISSLMSWLPFLNRVPMPCIAGSREPSAAGNVAETDLLWRNLDRKEKLGAKRSPMLGFRPVCCSRTLPGSSVQKTKMDTKRIPTHREIVLRNSMLKECGQGFSTTDSRLPIPEPTLAAFLSSNLCSMKSISSNNARDRLIDSAFN